MVSKIKFHQTFISHLFLFSTWFNIIHIPTHGSENKIYDLDIIRLLKSGLDEIIYHIIDGDIKNGRRFILSRDGGDNLNLVILPEKIDSINWNLVIITVMKKEDFNVGKGQLQIYV